MAAAVGRGRQWTYLFVFSRREARLVHERQLRRHIDRLRHKRWRIDVGKKTHPVVHVIKPVSAWAFPSVGRTGVPVLRSNWPCDFRTKGEGLRKPLRER
jgi:hypothetical protein